MARLAPPYDAGHGGGGFPGQARRRATPCGSRQTERNESKTGNRSLMREIALIPTVAEIRALIMRLMTRTSRTPDFIFAWSLWRRKHQAQAMVAHYTKRGYLQL